MTRTCVACGVAVAPGSRFCQACGYQQPPPAAARLSPRFSSPVAYTPPHLAERILTTRSALVGEHKRVTVLFCDIVGSTAIAERLGPERMHELLGWFFNVALEEVHRYEGTINQFLGDGFMALFGAPLALEHHERQAMLAALGVRRRVNEPAPIDDTNFRIRMGLNTGLVVVGRIGDNLRMDYTAVGDTTNIAARLQALASPGEILVSEATWEPVRELLKSEPLGPVSIQGRAAHVVAHRVTSLRDRSSKPDAPAHPLTRFLARERELAELREALEHARAGRGQALGIVGEPGMGKSRLISEFRRSVSDRDVACLEGACLSYGSTMPYVPVLDLLRNGCGIASDDTPEQMVDKVRSTIRQLDMDEGSALPYLLHLLGLKETTGPLDALPPAMIRTRTFETLRQLLLRGSWRRPLLLLIEDIHWIDQASEDFLLQMADVIPTASILFVTTYRPGYTPPWIQRSYATQVALRRLADRDALALGRALTEASSRTDAEIQAVVERGEGNPLFIEELVRTFGNPGASAIPDTLLGILTARIDRLSEEDKHLLQTAAVLGRDFAPRLLATMLGEPEGLEERLRHLVQLEFLNEIAAGAQPQFAFRHALTRDAVYHGLLDRRRRTAHAVAGRALERHYADRLDEVVELLAYHYDLSDDGENAVDYAIRAAERAQRRWANAEALTLFQRALARLDTLPDTPANQLRRIDAVTAQAEVLFALGRQEDHLTVLESIRGLVERVDDPARRAAWHYWTGFFHSLTGSSPDMAIAHCRTASDVARAAGLPTIQGYADTCLAQAYVVAGNLREAVETGERALRLFERLGDTWWANRALSQLSPAANHMGEWDRGLGYCRRAIELGRQLDDLRVKVSGLVRTASTHVQRGDWAPGLRFCDDALALQPTPFDAAAVHAVHGYGLVKAADLDRGIEELREALAFYDRSHLQYTRSLFALWLIDAYLRADERRLALALTREVLRAAQAVGYRHIEGVANRLLGEGLAVDDAAAAASHLEAAERILEPMQARNEVGKLWVARACLNPAAPDRDLLGRALALFRTLGTVDEPVRVERILDAGSR